MISCHPENHQMGGYHHVGMHDAMEPSSFGAVSLLAAHFQSSSMEGQSPQSPSMLPVQPLPSNVLQPLQRESTPYHHHQHHPTMTPTGYLAGQNLGDDWSESAFAQDICGYSMAACSYRTMAQEYEKDTWRMYERIQAARSSSVAGPDRDPLNEPNTNLINVVSNLIDQTTDFTELWDHQPDAYDDQSHGGIFELDL